MGWTGQTFSVGQVLTAAQLNNLQNDITAFANQDAGAPAPATDFITLDTQITDGIIGQSEVGANAIHQSELATSQANAGGSVSASSTLEVTLQGGNYMLTLDGYQSATDAGAGFSTLYTPVGAATYEHRAQLTNNAGGTRTIYIRSTYVSASPPYDLGNGVVAYFIQLVVNKTTGALTHFYCGNDPMWMYYGKTNSISKYNKKGKSYRMATRLDMEKTVNNVDVFAMLKNPSTRQQALDIINDPKKVELEITQEIKNRDKDDVPHPFFINPATEEVVTLNMIDDSFLLPLKEMSESGECIGDLFMNDYIRIDNNHITGMQTAAGMKVVKPTWKNTI